MQCERIEQRLGAFLDGELSPAEAQEVRAHLMACTSCQQALRELKSLDAFMSDYEDEPLPPTLERKLAAIGHKPMRRLRWVRDLSLAASVAAAFYLGIFVSGEVADGNNADDVFAFGQESLYSLYQEAGR
ncbi:MAG: zf-HC2 domain-containing protein [Candidatus Cloacimonetes bacterium]|nr:zf-HC2 domain-containing protein [Candidatus Cloacimonadota bacterium]